MRMLLAAVGVLFVMTGVAAADSEKLWVPAVMVAVGLVLVKLSMPTREEDE